MIVNPLRELHHSGFGVADQDGRAVTADTPFLIGSLTKPMTATLVMQLIAERKFNLDDLVRDVLPGFSLADTLHSRTITIRDLLSHRSGIPRWAGLRSTGGASSLAQVVADYADVEPSGPARTTFTYSNANYLILGAILERVTGRSYADLVHERLFSRLGATHAFTSPPAAEAAGLAQGYRIWFGIPVAESPTWDPLRLPAGDLIFSSRDLGSFARAMLNFGMLDGREVLEISETMTMFSFPDGWRYALGWARRGVGDHLAVGHGGAYATFQAELILLPQDGLGVILLANTTGMFLQDGIRQAAIDVARLMVGLPPEGKSSGVSPRLKGYALGLGVLLLTLSTVRSLVRLPRWRDRLRTARLGGVQWPRNAMATVIWEALVLILVPIGLRRFAGITLSTLPEVQADIGYWLWLSLALTLLTLAIRLVWLFESRRTQSIQTA